jgi:hypothetical protein
MELPPDVVLVGTLVAGMIGAVPFGLLVLGGKPPVGLSVLPSDPAWLPDEFGKPAVRPGPSSELQPISAKAQSTACSPGRRGMKDPFEGQC